MNKPTSPLEILSQFQSLVSSLPNIPTSLPPSSNHESTTTHPSIPVLSPLIPSIPSSTSLTPSPSLATLSSHLTTHILPYLPSSSLSPNYYGFVTGGTTPAALLADWLVTLYDQNIQVHLPGESIATVVEARALELVRGLFGLEEHTWGVEDGGQGGGTFTTGATASNILGLARGREYVLRTAAQRRKSHLSQSTEAEKDISVGEMGLYEAMLASGITKIKVLSTLPHSSIAKAASVVGLGRNSVISVVEQGSDVAIDLAAFEREASEEGTVSILVVSAGEVNTGRFGTNGLEMWKEIRRIADQYGVWVHVDGAFGLFARLLTGQGEEYEDVASGVEGLDLADSIAGDAHKMLNVPYDCGIFLTRHRQLSTQVFQNGNAAYLTSGMGEEDGIQSPLNIGIENSRRFRALPVYATIMTYGREGYLDMVKRQVLPRAENEDELRRKTFMIVLFRAKDEALNTVLVKKINGTGRMYVSGTKWDGQPAARIAISNWQAEVERDGNLIEQVLHEVSKT